MKKIEVNIIALSKSESSKGNYALILEEEGGFRRLVITIGAYEAQAIAVTLERMTPNRPLTHDLFKSTLDAADVRITEVIISDLIADTFHATVIGKRADQSTFEVDARASDAMALAVRYQCSIFTTDEILDTAGIMLDSPSKAFTNKRGRLSDYSLEELHKILDQVLAKEDYESATKIRDAIRQKEENE